ncbi:MAG TPA: polysaccharide biosynthesis tyrosine autokinase [Actinomycetota bacterium]|jgi:capsular exopolysaccharide synthesis family protein|nr:polysaccharide biosynthesis tyrosine autokinase [Actinomycetota bacterium]
MQTAGWPQPQESLLDLRDYLAVLKRRKKLIAVVAVVLVALSAAWTLSQTKIYTATAEVLVRSPITSATDTNGNPVGVNVENERQQLLSTRVARVVQGAFEPDISSSALLSRVEVTIPQDTDVLQVHYSDPSPEKAQEGAQAFAKGYLEYKTDQAQQIIADKVEVLESTIAIQRAAENPDRAAIAALVAQQANVLLTTIDPGEITLDAQLPSAPTSPNLPMNVALALLFGVVIGVVSAYVRERMDDHLRGRNDLEEVLAVPVMTMIPTVPGWRDKESTQLVSLQAPRSPAAEAYRTLRTSMLVAAAERGIKTIMVLSSVAAEGKSTTAANLGVVLAQAGKRVVLISADLRRPRIHEFFGLGPERGLSEVLLGERRPWESLKSGGTDNLWVMSSGHIPEQPTELLQSPAMQELITDQREVVDFIVLDCPPVLAVADALVLAPLVDGVIFVADAMSTPRGAVIQARAQLDQVGARMLGAVLNNVEAGGVGYAYYGGQYSYAPVASPETGVTSGRTGLWESLRRDRP